MLDEIILFSAVKFSVNIDATMIMNHCSVQGINPIFKQNEETFSNCGEILVLERRLTCALICMPTELLLLLLLLLLLQRFIDFRSNSNSNGNRYPCSFSCTLLDV